MINISYCSPASQQHVVFIITRACLLIIVIFLSLKSLTKGQINNDETKNSFDATRLLQTTSETLVWTDDDEDNQASSSSFATKNNNNTTQDCTHTKVANPKYLLIFYAIGIIYMFLALAVVCDEFFVPALEEISSEHHLNLSMDVAGATLMAAGGSAPELFTSFVGTFRESDIGIGTIVGSAVFNVLFVIGCCSMLSKEVLTLTWWPLFRDCVYYAIGLLVLTLLVGVFGNGEVLWYEALILLCMYVGYVVLMYYNRRLYTKLTGKELVLAGEEGEEEEDSGDVVLEEEATTAGDDVDATTADATSSGNTTTESNAASSAAEAVMMENGQGGDNNGLMISPKPSVDTANLDRANSNNGATSPVVTSPRNVQRGDFRWPNTFRAGVLKLLLHPESWVEKGGLGIVSKIQGDVDTVFKKIDSDCSGAIDKEELRQLFAELGHEINDDDFDQVFQSLDLDGNGTVSAKLSFSLIYL